VVKYTIQLKDEEALVSLTHLVSEMPDSLQRGAAVDRHKVLVEQRDQLLVVLNAATDIVHGGLLAIGNAHTGALEFLEHIEGADDGPDAMVAVFGSLLEDEGVLVALVALVVDAVASAGHRGGIDHRQRGQARFPGEPRSLQDLRYDAVVLLNLVILAEGCKKKRFFSFGWSIHMIHLEPKPWVWLENQITDLSLGSPPGR